MSQVSKELHVILSRRLPGRLTRQGQMHECRLRHTPLVRLLHQSRHVGDVIDVMMRRAWIADAWSMERSPNDVLIIHTHNKVIVAFQHGSQM
jgi:hypothetical protein